MTYVALVILACMIFSAAFVLCRVIAVLFGRRSRNDWEFVPSQKKQAPKPEERRNIAGQVMTGDILGEVRRRMSVHDLPAYQLRDGKIEPIDRITWKSVNPN